MATAPKPPKSKEAAATKPTKASVAKKPADRATEKLREDTNPAGSWPFPRA